MRKCNAKKDEKIRITYHLVNMISDFTRLEKVLASAGEDVYIPFFSANIVTTAVHPVVVSFHKKSPEWADE